VTREDIRVVREEMRVVLELLETRISVKVGITALSVVSLVVGLLKVLC
jgi:hypothetical protein